MWRYLMGRCYDVRGRIHMHREQRLCVFYFDYLPQSLSRTSPPTDYSQCIPSTATDVPSGGTASATSTSPMATGSQIRTVQDPVFHYYLQNIGGAPKLGPESSSGYFTIGSMITLNSDDGSSLYLNVNTSATTSYKPLSLDATATTTDWGLEGDTIITTNPRQLNFIACPTSNTTVYDVYLQNGNDTPAGTTCTLVTMHLPCLC
ncbi:hypothetical protein CPB85DRAFT_705313 [Mucidula mucida]|nr:hypothetical protein CPB85DRAFT_705313 [Mucidula mucida]